MLRAIKNSIQTRRLYAYEKRAKRLRQKAARLKSLAWELLEKAKDVEKVVRLKRHALALQREGPETLGDQK